MKVSTIFLVTALAVTTGVLGLTLTGTFDETQNSQLNAASAFMSGHLVVEAFDEGGNIIAYRQTDNEVVDDGEQCILKMLFGSTEGAGTGRGGYTSTGACTGDLTGAWTNIAIGTGTTAAADTQVSLVNETSTSHGLERGAATTMTWTNGTGADATKIVLSKTFTSLSPSAHTIAESGLFNSTVVDASGMLARQAFTGVALSNGDSITITWTFTVGN
jgi:hypothetical protein